jgi:iron only hydrogenase large subunit-like protein
MVKRAAGSTYEIIDRNGKISIAGQADISINDCRCLDKVLNFKVVSPGI